MNEIFRNSLSHVCLLVVLSIDYSVHVYLMFYNVST